ncbi:MAG: LPS assembly lipoprotein LptE [Desulfatiglandales bacterium]|nr:LPS assembly lipoprotein LptE [Desulfatiglandales bacterium]
MERSDIIQSLLRCTAPFLLAITLSLAGTLVVGCGYHFRADGQPLGINIQSLAIPLIDSTSSRIGFEADFTRIIREEFLSYGKVPLVPVERAQVVLSGRIHEIRADPLTYDVQEQTVQGQVTTNEVTSSRRLRIKLDIRLTERGTGRVIWHEEAMEEKAGFAVEEDPLANRFNQQQALEAVARLLAKRIFLKTMERF